MSVVFRHYRRIGLHLGVLFRHYRQINFNKIINIMTKIIKNKSICKKCHYLSGGVKPIAYFCISWNKDGQMIALSLNNKKISTRCPYILEHTVL